MKKIIIFCEGLKNRAGIERMTVELANLLSDCYRVIIVVIDQFSTEQCPYSIDPKVRVVSLNSSFHKSFLSLNLYNIRSLRKILTVEKPSAIITVATPLVRISAPAVIGLKIRNIAWEHFHLYAGSRAGSYYKMFAPWLVDATVVLTESDAKDYKAKHCPNVIVIPNFTSIGVNAPSKCDSKIILAVGRHAPQKGFDLLIKAWANVNAPGWKLRIVGSGDDKIQNMALARKLIKPERIEFVESTSNIAQEFQRASCFVLSSRFEGLVLVLIEARMMGLPCISFDCPNSPREVIRDGIDGWLVPHEEIDALAKELELRLSDVSTLKSFGKKARIDALNRYSPEAIKDFWIKLIEPLK